VKFSENLKNEGAPEVSSSSEEFISNSSFASSNKSISRNDKEKNLQK
jgi:hypothetical protein